MTSTRLSWSQSHISVNFDRTHFQRDLNVVLPIDRMRELAQAGEIGGVSPIHFSILGATESFLFEQTGAELARRMRDLGVDTAMLVPV